MCDERVDGFLCSWFGINIVLLLLPVITVNSSDSAAQCDDPRVSVIPLEDYDMHKDRGGLNAMCKAAGGMRYDIIKDRFPYKFAAEQAKMW